MNQTGEIKQFSFSSGALALDFANTADGDVNNTWTENLVTYDDLVAWSQQANILSNEEASALYHYADTHPQQAEAVREQAVALRWTIYAMFSAAATEYAPTDEIVNDFNTALTQAMVRLRVVPQSDGFEWQWTGDESPDRMFAPIVWSAAQLLTTHEQLHFVRECGGESCSWLFVDASRNHSRRWCDMKGCGNRAKAKRFYQRTKDSDE